MIIVCVVSVVRVILKTVTVLMMLVMVMYDVAGGKGSVNIVEQLCKLSAWPARS